MPRVNCSKCTPWHCLSEKTPPDQVSPGESFDLSRQAIRHHLCWHLALHILFEFARPIYLLPATQIPSIGQKPSAA